MLNQVWYQSNDLDQELIDAQIEWNGGIKKPVSYYKTIDDEIITLCKQCANNYGEPLEEIDLAGQWDDCPCGAQNV